MAFPVYKQAPSNMLHSIDILQFLPSDGRPMDAFEQINKNREDHGYTQMHLTRYKNFCNRRCRELRRLDGPDSLLYRLEANFAKFLLFKSPRYLHRCLRLLKGKASDFHLLYREYIACHLSDYHKKLPLDDLVKLRHKLADFYSFLNDIYQLSDDRVDFDQYKTRYQWNDVTLLFETPRMAAAFADGSFALSDNRFNTQLATKILTAQKTLNSFKSAVLDSDAALLDVFNASTASYNSVSHLQQFLEDNYVVSSYTKQLLDDVSSVHGFITQLVEYKNGNVHTHHAHFVPPALFRDCAKGLEALEKRRAVDSSSLRSALVGMLEQRLKPYGGIDKMPFLPVFYDIAYDYIQYPPLEHDVIRPLKNMSISGELTN